MIGFIIRRFIQAVLVLILVIFVMFVLAHLVPGGEARAVLGPRAQPLEIRNFNRQNGLNLPLWNQFFRYIWKLARLQFGRAVTYNQSVSSLIALRLPRTLILVGLATVFALLVAVPLGIYQVVRRNKPDDYVVTGLSFIFYSTPAFLIGTLLILYFAIDLHVFPVEGPQGGGSWSDIENVRALVLPVLTLSALTIALVQSLHALVHDGDDDRGLHPNGTSERCRASTCPLRARLEECSDPHHHADRSVLACDSERRCHNRGRLQLSGNGQAGRGCGLPGRRTHTSRRDLRDHRGDGGREPIGGHLLRRRRSEGAIWLILGTGQGSRRTSNKQLLRGDSGNSRRQSYRACRSSS